MGYVSLECEWTEDGQKQGLLVSRSTKDGEDYIATQTAEILRENPKAKNIVVTEEPYNEGHPYALDALIDLILERRPDLKRERLEELDYLILNTDRDKYRRGAYIVPLSEAKAVFDNEDSDYRDWVYFREFGIVIFDVTKHTSHEIFLSHWYHILTHILPTKADFERKLMRANTEEDAEKFLHAQHGFYLSGAFNLWLVPKSTNMKLTAQEKVVFGKARFRDYEPD